MPLPSYDRKYHQLLEQKDKIRELAYSLWEKSGKPHGKDVQFWHEAEEQLGIISHDKSPRELVD